MDAFNGVPATGITPAIGEKTLRPSRMTLVALYMTESSWMVEVGRWPGRSDCLFTVTGARLIETGMIVSAVDRPAAMECFGVRSPLNRSRRRMGMNLLRIPIL